MPRRRSESARLRQRECIGVEPARASAFSTGEHRIRARFHVRTRNDTRSRRIDDSRECCSKPGLRRNNRAELPPAKEGPYERLRCVAEQRNIVYGRDRKTMPDI